ncbi:RagB/SusD family nutrient uptake outer membrane protein [Fulvivirga sediminis]|uniref:RagB/SusD family nutrient uptake outer membrane protein n=1 Tax=Fulvivirga sediminis TaxID=2803949 RepID=A0A937F9G3_9BACT|nr:RagB/SusD family nutrient uptake outer membrane protein [Fulvivirga sediminis]MBL3658937.1 RagB/SusD family nutrient uptake outer membrane protein [Fulvivirga sediminis]
MNYKYIKSTVRAALVALLLVGCSDILDEQPRSNLTPEFFETEKGIHGGVTSLYAHLRYIYGQAYYYNTCETGTDEATFAQSADDNFKVMDLSPNQTPINPSNSRSDALWQAAFPNINIASGIIEHADEVGVSEDLAAEARFFRAFDYFMLVQTFGGVPLDLGAGELAFNTKAVRTSVRNTVPEVYTKAIFPDLLSAVENLPENPRMTGTVTKTVARLYLAKAYLTYGWWLENPNNIPTYPEASRQDPDGKDAQYYYQQAYDIAMTAINNPGPYSLQPTYYDVNVATNDRNSEILLYADHTESSEYYNGGSLTYGSGGAPDNFAVWMMTWNYTNIRSSSSSTKWDPISSVQREAEQHLGRPWTRMCPTIGVIENTFADKTNDSRYDGTFTTVYRANYDKAGIDGPVYNANFEEALPGDAILTFLDEEPATAIDYSVRVDIDRNGDGVISGDNEVNQDPSNIGAGVLSGRKDFVIGPRDISRIVYPGLWKLGVYRTDNNGTLGQPNAASTRPFNIAKFSELYFVAAEAAVKGATGAMSARDLINVIRERAGKWRFDNNGNTEKFEDNSAAMTAATPATIDINYILMERSREYYGEGYRWYDLVRTQKWAELAGSYEIAGINYFDHTPELVTRDIKPYHYLRPIPQGQLDAMQGATDVYQNPGY